MVGLPDVANHGFADEQSTACIPFGQGDRGGVGHVEEGVDLIRDPLGVAYGVGVACRALDDVGTLVGGFARHFQFSAISHRDR